METRFGVVVAIFLISFTSMKSTCRTNNTQLIQEQKDVDKLEIKLIQTPNSRQLRNRLAAIYVEMNNIEEAEQHLQYLVAQDSSDAVALNNLGNVLFMKGNLDSAETLYLKAINFTASKRDSDGIYLNLGLIYAAADLDSQAVEMFGQAMRDSNDYHRVGDLLGIRIEDDDRVKDERLVPKKKLDSVTVKKVVDKARKKKQTGKSKKIKTKKTLGGKGALPREQIEHIFYWAY